MIQSLPQKWVREYVLNKLSKPSILDGFDYHPRRNASPEELSYLAGLVDGEGSVTLARTSNRNAFRTPCLTISSTDIELVLPAKEIFGGQIQVKHSVEKLGYKRAYDFRIRSLPAIRAMERIRPYMLHPRKCKRIDSIVENYELLTLRNGRYTDIQKELKSQFEEKFFAIE